jgi:signal peptidase I
MEKITKRFGGLERFDVVVFNPENGQHDSYIKRIIGLPGEKVRIDEMGNIYIDGEILNENYGKETINDPGNAVTEITLGKNEYFVLGDNRNDSLDSRNELIGCISEYNIIGKVAFDLGNASSGYVKFIAIIVGLCGICWHLVDFIIETLDNILVGKRKADNIN